VIDVVDGLRDLLEPPDAQNDGFSLNGVAIDRSCAEPIGDAQANTVYAWEEACRDKPIGTGEVQRDFEIVVLYVADGAGELAIGQRSRDVSEALDAKREAYMKLIRENANIGFGGDAPTGRGNIQATSDADALRQFATRGIAIRVTGWRLVTGQ
jgi:hypothetical protein